MAITGREDKIFALAEDLEVEFDMVGATAIEDRL